VLPAFVVIAMIAAFSVVSSRHQAQTQHPKFTMLNFKDRSLSFTGKQFKKMLNVHDQVFSTAFAGEPVKYTAYEFGNDIQQTGTLVASTPKETWPVIDRQAVVDPGATRFSLALGQIEAVAEREPGTIIGVLFESDGEATDWPAFDAAAKRLAKCPNVAFIAVGGVIPSSRLRLARAMAPFGDRFSQFDLADFNSATTMRLAALVRKAGGQK